MPAGRNKVPRSGNRRLGYPRTEVQTMANPDSDRSDKWQVRSHMRFDRMAGAKGESRDLPTNHGQPHQYGRGALFAGAENPRGHGGGNGCGWNERRANSRSLSRPYGDDIREGLRYAAETVREREIPPGADTLRFWLITLSPLRWQKH